MVVIKVKKENYQEDEKDWVWVRKPSVEQLRQRAREKNQKYYLENKEHLAQVRKAWYETNKEYARNKARDQAREKRVAEIEEKQRLGLLKPENLQKRTRKMLEEYYEKKGTKPSSSSQGSTWV